MRGQIFGQDRNNASARNTEMQIVREIRVEKRETDNQEMNENEAMQQATSSMQNNAACLIIIN